MAILRERRIDSFGIRKTMAVAWIQLFLAKMPSGSKKALVWMSETAGKIKYIPAPRSAV
jgi:hypothetical protein